MGDDYFTNTEADAGAYERQRAMDEYDDDRPSPSDLAREYDYDFAQSVEDAREARAMAAGLWVYPDHWPPPL